MSGARFIFRCLLLFAVMLTRGICAEEEPGVARPAKSPDGKFVVRADEKEEVAGFARKTGRKVLAMPEMMVRQESLRTVWAKDSQHVALNYQAGTRYFPTSLYAWNGSKFVELPSPEDALTKVLVKEKARQMKEAKLPADAYERRIHDSFVTRRWLDAKTVEVDANSIRTVTERGEGEKETVDVEADFRCTIRYVAKTKQWRVLKALPKTEKKE